MTTQLTVATRVGSVACLLDLPSNSSFPVVFLLHGFTGWKEEEHLASLARDLCANGIGAVRFDAPGSGESEGTFADDYRMTNYLTSVEDVMAFVRSEYGSTLETTGIWGHSMGGFVAIASACRLRNVAAVCGSQSSVGRKAFSPEEVELWRVTGWASFSNDHFSVLELPYDFYLDRQQYDIFDVIDGLSAPLLLISGTFDQLAPTSQVESIYRAAPEPKFYREFPADHDYKHDKKQLEDINAATVAFFAERLLG